MILRFIFSCLIFIAFNRCFAQDAIQRKPFHGQAFNSDSLLTDSIKRINAFPAYFRPYVAELSQLEFQLDKVVSIKRYDKEYPSAFIREVLEPTRPYGFTESIFTDTLLLNDSLRGKLNQVIRQENYFGLKDGKLVMAEQITYMQQKNRIDCFFISLDRKALLFCDKDSWDCYSRSYYYFEGTLIAVNVCDRIYSTEAELSQFSDMRNLPGVVNMILELENGILNN